VILTKYDSDDHIKYEMSRACGTYGEEQNCTKGFWWGHVQYGVHFDNSGVDMDIEK
jgi:hypothetical protein